MGDGLGRMWREREVGREWELGLVHKMKKDCLKK